MEESAGPGARPMAQHTRPAPVRDADAKGLAKPFGRARHGSFEPSVLTCTDPLSRVATIPLRQADYSK